MKSIVSFTITIIVAMTVSASYARDDIGSYNIKAALSTEDAKAKLGNDIQFYFGDQKHGKVTKKFGVFGTNKKSNAFNKSDQEVCEWVFLTAMLQMKSKAQQLGANAVINIKSNYRNVLTSSTETFQCGAGTFVAGVALQGEFVTIGK